MTTVQVEWKSSKIWKPVRVHHKVLDAQGEAGRTSVIMGCCFPKRNQHDQGKGVALTGMHPPPDCTIALLDSYCNPVQRPHANHRWSVHSLCRDVVVYSRRGGAWIIMIRPYSEWVKCLPCLAMCHSTRQLAGNTPVAVVGPYVLAELALPTPQASPKKRPFPLHFTDIKYIPGLNSAVTTATPTLWS